MKKFKATILLVAACAALAGCGILKGTGKKDPTLDKAGRVNMSLADQKLTADPELAATTVTIPRAGGQQGLAAGGRSAPTK